MKKYIFTIFSLFLLVGSTAYLNAQTQFWTGTYEDLQKEAKVTEKNYFLMFHTDWCMPCKKMEAEVFADFEAGKFIERHFIPYMVDGEKGNYTHLVQELFITSYPTIVLFNSKGEEIKRINGYNTKDILLEEFKQHIPGVTQTRFSDFR